MKHPSPPTRQVSSEATSTSSKTEEDLVPVQVSSKRVKPLEVLYKGKTYTLPPLFRSEWLGINEDRTLLNDTLIEFYLCMFMWDERYDDERRLRSHVFNTFFYDKLQTHFRHHFKNIQPRKSELGNHFNQMFNKVRPSFFLDKEVLVVPCHLKKPKHWFLVLIHNPSGAILRRKAPVQPAEENNNEARKSLSEELMGYADFEERNDCRIVIMDSLCHSRKYGQLIASAHDQVFDYISVWLQMAAAANGDVLMASRIRKVVCQTLPKQTNSVDCGIFMMAYAEYFTWFNTEWMQQPTESLVYLKMDDMTTEVLKTVTSRLRLEETFHRYRAPSS